MQTLIPANINEFTIHLFMCLLAGPVYLIIFLLSLYNPPPPPMCVLCVLGAFLLPYLFCLVTLGMPLLYLEMALGQYSSQGPVGAWQITPLLAGELLYHCKVVPATTRLTGSILRLPSIVRPGICDLRLLPLFPI